MRLPAGLLSSLSQPQLSCRTLYYQAKGDDRHLPFYCSPDCNEGSRSHLAPSPPSLPCHTTNHALTHIPTELQHCKLTAWQRKLSFPHVSELNELCLTVDTMMAEMIQAADEMEMFCWNLQNNCVQIKSYILTKYVKISVGHILPGAVMGSPEKTRAGRAN